MKRNSKFDLRQLCGEISTEDGINPLTLKKQHGRKRDTAKAGRCRREIYRITESVFTGLTDPLLDGVILSAVEEQSGTALVLLIFELSHPVTSAQFDEIYACLNRLTGLFRAEIARQINRKRTPELRVSLKPQITGGFYEG